MRLWIFKYLFDSDSCLGLELGAQTFASSMNDLGVILFQGLLYKCQGYPVLNPKIL